MTKYRGLSGAALFLFVMWATVPAHANPVAMQEGWGPFLLKPGDVLRASFDLRWFVPPPSLETFNVLQFMPGVNVLEPVGSYSTRLHDRGRLLGTYAGTGANAAQIGFGSWFIAPGTPYTRGNPTVIDFGAFQDGTFDGGVEFQIHDGLAHLYRASDELDLGQALSPDIASGYGFAPRIYEIVAAEPVPEPASLLLLATGGVGVAVRVRSRRRRIRP